MTGRYAHAGRLYDLVSLEPLYRSARRRLLELAGLRPGMTVVDVGCGTGRNLPALQRAVGRCGRVVGVDTSTSMLGAARRRIAREEVGAVTLVHGDATSLDPVLRAAGIGPATVDVVVTTFVLSLLPDDAAFWGAVDEWSADRPLRVASADLGPPDLAPAVLRPLLGALTAFGGGDPDRRPWDRLLVRCADGVHEQHLGGHVHLAAGTCGPPATAR